MQCDQGDGSPADTEAYGACQSSCINSLFLTATDAAGATGTNSLAASNSASATGSAAGSATGSATGSAAGSATGSATGSSAGGSSSGMSPYFAHIYIASPHVDSFQGRPAPPERLGAPPERLGAPPHPHLHLLLLRLRPALLAASRLELLPQEFLVS
jgi:hypothetical protein